jgi:hypothetical protein
MAARKKVSLQLDEMTDRQLLLHVVIPSLTRLEKLVTELDSAVDDLKNAVDGVAQRLLPKIADLEAALAAAQADDANAAEAAANAQAAVAAIRAEVDALNALGTDPSTPVDTETPPADPPPIEVPADPAAGAGDGTDLPAEPPMDEPTA